MKEEDPVGELADNIRRMVELKDERIAVLEAENSKLRIERRGFQIMARRMVISHDPCFRSMVIEEGKYERAGGDVPCPECRHLYVEHPQLAGLPTIHLLCSGAIVKL